MLDSAFKNLSISGWYNDGGNRLPALSASSLSSIGEDPTSHRIDSYHGFHGNPQNASPLPYSSGIQGSPYSSTISPSGRNSLGPNRPTGRDNLGATVHLSNAISEFNEKPEMFPNDSFKESFLFNRSTRPYNYEMPSEKPCHENTDEFNGGAAIGTWDHHLKFPQSINSVRESKEFSFDPGPNQRYHSQQQFDHNNLMIPSIQRVQSADAAYNISLRYPNRNVESYLHTAFSDSSNRSRTFSSDYKHVHRSAEIRNERHGGEYTCDDGPTQNFSLREVQANYGHYRNGFIPNESPNRFQGHVESLPFYKINPQVAPATISKKNVYIVKFKRSRKNFLLSDALNKEIKIGTYVKVEADRGEDLGVVLSRIPLENFSLGTRICATNGGSSDLELKRIICLASKHDIEQYLVKEEEEAELLKICRSKTAQRGLPMNVIDAEYQFDRHKLTFFFEASCRVDFRDLVRDLFSIYKTRIWMQQIDKNSGHPFQSLEPLHVHASEW